MDDRSFIVGFLRENTEALGFQRVNVLRPENRRRRAIYVYRLDLWPTLFNEAGGGV